MIRNSSAYVILGLLTFALSCTEAKAPFRNRQQEVASHVEEFNDSSLFLPRREQFLRERSNCDSLYWNMLYVPSNIQVYIGPDSDSAAQRTGR